MTTFPITIDGKELTARSGQTILQVCRQNGISVPFLCYEPRLSPLGTCRVCTVEVEGQGLTISCSTLAAAGMVVHTRSEAVIAARKAKVEQLVADHYGDCLAPCHLACPAGIDVPGYIALITRGAYQEAVDLIGEAIPLPGVCGRICPHPCETVCRRSLVEDAIAINNLKRFASQHAGLIRFLRLDPIRSSGRQVAVIGSGPAGLAAAYFLALKGHRVTIFESHSLPGGMLRYGIPAYRLPKDILDAEIDHILSLGIALETGRRLGKDFTLHSLFSRGFAAVFLATGAAKSSRLNIPGEDLEGVISGTDLLFRVASNTPVNLGKRVAVIGGGNTAVDAARTAQRLGAAEVALLYRRSRSRMPAIPEEVAEAEKEGVRLHFQVAPVRLEGAGGQVQRLVCEKTALGRPDASGRPAPEPVPGSEFALPVDSVIIATGQQPELSWLTGEPPEWSQIRSRDHGGTIAADPQTFATAIRGVFAGGDAVSGPATAIEAMAAGKKAAIAIDRYVQGVPLYTVKQFNSVKGKLEEINKGEYQKVAVARRETMPELPPDARRLNFKEVALGYTEAEARREADRCLRCGCSATEKCTLRSLATEYGIPTPPPKKDRFHFPVDNSNPFVERDDNKCVLCGVCARVCREIIGAAALPSTFRVAESSAIVPLTRTNCITCGECTAVCPVGAMSPARDLIPAKETSTICPYCSVGCGVILGTRGEAIVSARGETSSPVSRGNLCFRGRFGHEFVNHHARLTHPLIRRHGRLVKSTWEDALELVSRKLGQYQGDRSAVLASAKILNEESHVLRKFARTVMGATNITSTALARHTPVLSALSEQFGGAPPGPAISDLAKSACFLVAGSDLSTSYPVLWQELRKAVNNGATLIVIDPRETEAARLANLWLQPRPGTDLALVAGMMNVMVQENLLDAALIESRATGFQSLKDSLAAFGPEQVEAISGIPGDRVADAAYSFMQNRPGMVICGSGVSQQPNAAELGSAFGNLVILAGDYDRPGAGLLYLMGQNNVHGALGALGPGLSLDGLLSAALNGPVKAAYVVGSNPVSSAGTKAPETLRQLEFLVVQDLFLTETAALAHVVLPAASFAEKEGTFTNLERREQKVTAAIPPVGEARPDWWIICEIARRLGGQGFSFSNAGEIAAEMACPVLDTGANPAGPPAAFPSAKIKLAPLSSATAASEPPATLITKHPYHFNTRTMTGKLPGIEAIDSSPRP